MTTSLLLILICLSGGSAFILMKYAVLVFTPIEIALYRLLGGATFLGCIWLVQRRVPGIPRRQWPMLAVLSLVGIGLPFSLQPWLIDQTQNSGFIGMMIIFMPLMTLLVSIPLLQVWPNWRELTGVLVGLAALLIVRLDSSARSIPFHVLLLALMIPLLYATLNTCVRRCFNNSDPLHVSFSMLGMAAIVLIPLAPMQVRSADTGNFGLALAAVLVLGIVATGLSTYLFFVVNQRVGPLHAGMVGYMIPAVALGWSWFLKEEITGRQVIALATALLMVWLVRSGRTNIHTNPGLDPVENTAES
jgi:drug/metabolite transporter (DMT)-like permease